MKNIINPSFSYALFLLIVLNPFMINYENISGNTPVLYYGRTVEEGVNIPLNLNAFNGSQSVLDELNQSDSVNVTWMTLNVSFSLNMSIWNHVEIVHINASGYFGRITAYDSEFRNVWYLSEIINVTNVIVWKDNDHSGEYYYREALKSNSLPNISGSYDQEKNEFVISEFDESENISTRLIVDTLRGVTKKIVLYESSASYKGTFNCDRIEISVGLYVPQNDDENFLQIIFVSGFLIVISFVGFLYKYRRMSQNQ
ncbi:MAG: hypothetical protein ACFFFG_02025 [Candidatus Thorarchaeota archaeon]